MAELLDFQGVALVGVLLGQGNGAAIGGGAALFLGGTLSDLVDAAQV